MPKHEAMAQLSRPFQVVLVAFLLLAGVWLFALQGHSTSTGGSGSSAAVSTAASAPAPAATAKAHSAAPTGTAKAGATPTHVYHGPVPGLEGLSRDVNRAHEAVTKVNASPTASSTTTTTHPANAPAAASQPATKTKAATQPATSTSTKTPASTGHKTSTAPRSASGAAALTGQRAVEADLAKGDVVVLLFWNRKGTEDVAVHRAVQQLARAGQRIAVQEASASQVASFGSITRGVQVYTTPTIFIINKHKQAIVLTGVQDAFSIGQALDEARQS